ncbi:hypothetical protein [Shewanella glacialimarina]|uniref:hypothetical protein n=1 Tax=Shewanella glacialimarina TaxID=2590884 RepID=UPI001CF8B713|nr:hypothetical protein [Shewanella glacialimarina]UCX04447.1 hypothetical protein FJ709_08005 [Shewanella glacialimarina]
MSIIAYSGGGHLGTFCRGHELVCQFGYSHLICKPVDKPQDPLLNLPDMSVVVSATFGEQFLLSRHSWKNETDILSRIYHYLIADDYAGVPLSESELVSAISIAFEQRLLLVIPIDKD